MAVRTSGVLGHIGIPGLAPFIAVALFFGGTGAALGAYALLRDRGAGLRRAMGIGLGVVAFGSAGGVRGGRPPAVPFPRGGIGDVPGQPVSPPAAPFEQLDFVYTPSRDVAADVDYFADVLGGRVVFAIDSMGTRVAAVELTGRRDF